MVTAMPVTGVSGLPALNVSTVGSVHGTPLRCAPVDGAWLKPTKSLRDAAGAFAARRN